MKSINFYEERDVLIIDVCKIREIRNSDFKKIVLRFDVRNENKYFDLSKLFYKKYKMKKRGLISLCYPVLNTINVAFLDVLKVFILDLLNRSYRHETLMSKLSLISSIVSDLNKFNIDINVESKEKALDLYVKYSEKLNLIRYTKAKEGKMHTTNMYYKQMMLSEIISSYFTVDIDVIKNLAPILPYIVPESRKPVGERELSEFFKLNKKLFMDMKDFLINNEKIPFILKNYSSFNDKVFFHIVDGDLNSRKYDNYIYNDKYEIRDFKEARERCIEFFKGSIDENHFRKVYYYHNVEYSKKNEKLSFYRQKFVNKTTCAFAACLICETSINFGLIKDLKISDFKNYKTHTNGLKLITIKPRANNKIVEFSCSNSFYSLLNEYLIFREWLISSYPYEIKGDNLLLNLTSSKNKEGYILGNFKNSQYDTTYVQWFKKSFPEVKWINAATIRVTCSNIFYNLTNSSVIVAEKLSNTLNVSEKNYSETTSLEHREQLTNYFEKFYSKIILDTRKSSEKLEINFLDSENDDKKIPLGHCENNIPTLKKGLRNMDEPKCINPSSCLFCENFALNLNREDFRKILSLKELTKLIEDKNKSDEILLIQYRIEEILSIIKEKFPKFIKEIEFVDEEINQGLLDKYWLDQYELLLELGF